MVALSRYLTSMCWFIRLHPYPNIPQDIRSWWIPRKSQGQHLRTSFSSPFLPTCFQLWVMLVSIGPTGCTHRRLLVPQHTSLHKCPAPSPVLITAFCLLKTQCIHQHRFIALPPQSLSIPGTSHHAGKRFEANLESFKWTKTENHHLL